jgi:apolipoprotein D and lipocalin family protein
MAKEKGALPLLLISWQILKGRKGTKLGTGAMMTFARICMIAAALLSTGLASCTLRPTVPLATVESVDLARYMGDWYEIALLPNRFQSMCVADTQASYRLDGDVVRVRNRCRNAGGAIEQADGIAKVVEGSRNAKLRVSFFRPFYGDYWILALDPDYRWVLIGEPSRRYGWVLSRTPNLDDALLQIALDKAAALGFDRTAFRRTQQIKPLE